MTLGRALMDSGDLAAARAEFEAVVKGAPDNILASRFLGECLEGLGGRRRRTRALPDHADPRARRQAGPGADRGPAGQLEARRPPRRVRLQRSPGRAATSCGRRRRDDAACRRPPRRPSSCSRRPLRPNPPPPPRYLSPTPTSPSSWRLRTRRRRRSSWVAWQEPPQAGPAAVPDVLDRGSAAQSPLELFRPE
jgi:hypothetical protein